ncbi:glycosyltransferase family 4 protein [Calidithermus timidus]|jgi:glycosyltransferase involved in cell wall biosynthesis|uniref:glycosyltransferase family 4 protein n=1 Tax=Calidithermus timidus TaxID=307124 RepID=UPI00035FE582|nr:glycosyltransferase family 4 protein [Calidithermus timidus]
MRVLHLVGNLLLPKDPERERASGAVRVALELARAQARAGHQPWVVSIGPEAWGREWLGVRLLQLKPLPWARTRGLDFRNHLPYVLLCLRESFDVAHGHLYSYLRFLRVRARVVHVHHDPLHGADGAELPLIVRHCDALIAVSKFVARRLERGLDGTGQVFQVYNAVDTARFDPARYARERLELRERWGVKAGDPVWLYAGAIVPEKGVLHLARAFARLAERVPQAHLVIAGGSALWRQSFETEDPQAAYELEVRRTLTAAEARGQVHWLGVVGGGEMPAIYAACDAVVVPSVWGEPFGLVAAEALASERPVVASSVGGLVEVVQGSGRLVPPGDEAALENALRDLSHNPILRQQLGAHGRRAMLALTWEKAAAEVEAVYHACLHPPAAIGSRA